MGRQDTIQSTKRQETIQSSKRTVLKLVRHYLKQRTPSGYSLKVDDDGVMYVNDGVGEQHERWYVVVRPEPRSIADTRAAEIEELLGDVERQLTRNQQKTVFLMSALPVI